MGPKIGLWAGRGKSLVGHHYPLKAEASSDFKQHTHAPNLLFIHTACVWGPRDFQASASHFTTYLNQSDWNMFSRLFYSSPISLISGLYSDLIPLMIRGHLSESKWRMLVFLSRSHVSFLELFCFISLPSWFGNLIWTKANPHRTKTRPSIYRQ